LKTVLVHDGAKVRRTASRTATLAEDWESRPGRASDECHKGPADIGGAGSGKTR
jgi:hypothetical protein